MASNDAEGSCWSWYTVPKLLQDKCTAVPYYYLIHDVVPGPVWTWSAPDSAHTPCTSLTFWTDIEATYVSAYLVFSISNIQASG